MTLGLILAIMTAAAIFAVLWPLSRSQIPPRAGSDVEVYRDQLDEIERDRAAGRIGEREAEAARIEVSRRLLAAADTNIPPPAATGSVWRRRTAALVALIVLPLGAGTLYLLLGSPQLPGQPLEARREAASEQQPILELVERVEAHLEKNPDDARGWEVIGPVYMRLGRYEDAVRARRNVLQLLGENATRQSDLGEALTAAANGVVTAEAKAAFDRASALDPKDARTRYFLGLAAEQDGKPKKAAEMWRALLAEAPSDAGWSAFVRESLARVDPSAAKESPQPGPSEGDIAAASGMSPEQRSAMIRGMVARLADRLKQDGSDVEGWLRLVRAYMVLGEKDKAKAAADDARRALANDADKLKRVEGAIKGLGLDS